jgi:hypothetical protein
MRFNYPEVGPLELHGEKLTISGTAGRLIDPVGAAPGVPQD